MHLTFKKLQVGQPFYVFGIFYSVIMTADNVTHLSYTWQSFEIGSKVARLLPDF